MPQPSWSYILCPALLHLFFTQCQQTIQLSTSSVSTERMHAPTLTTGDNVNFPADFRAELGKRTTAHNSRKTTIPFYSSLLPSRRSLVYLSPHPPLQPFSHTSPIWGGRWWLREDFPLLHVFSSHASSLTPWTHTRSSWSLAGLSHHLFLASNPWGTYLQSRWFVKYLFQVSAALSPCLESWLIH